MRTRGEGVDSEKYFYVCSGVFAQQKMAKGRPIVGALWLVSPLVGYASRRISCRIAVIVDMVVSVMLNDVVDIRYGFV
jgi:hypothetical protein